MAFLPITDYLQGTKVTLPPQNTETYCLLYMYSYIVNMFTEKKCASNTRLTHLLVDSALGIQLRWG